MIEYYNDDDLQRIYNSEYFSGRYESSPKNWYVKARFIQRILNPERILDIGCAGGNLVAELIELGIEAYGIDGSSYALSKADQTIKDKVFQVNLNSDRFPFEDEYFDAVSSLHTVEHIHRIDHFASELFRVMCHDSKAWIVTPDTDAEMSNEFDVNLNRGKEWQKIFLNHGFMVKKQWQYGFLDLKGKLAPLKLYKLPEPILTWSKYAIYWYLNEFKKKKAEGKESSFILIKP